MHSIQVRKFGGPEVLVVESNISVPEPQANEVLVRVGACGVNPVEAYIRAGAFNILPKTPYTPGGDAAGIVEKVGSGVTNVRPGQRVWTYSPTLTNAFGSYAQYFVVSAWHVFPLPERLSFEEGACLGIPYLTAMRALMGRPKVRSVLVHGASGGVGIAASQIASAMGLEVFGTAGTEEGLFLIRQHGVTKAYNHRENGYEKQIMELTNGNGVDLILEMAAHNNLDRDCDMIARGGTIVVIGCRDALKFDPRKLMGNESSIEGLTLYSATTEEIQVLAKELNRFLDSGKCKPVIQQVYPMDQAAQAHRDIMDHSKPAKGKLVIKIQDL